MTTSYSHGLEKIYSFEVLNPQTVRRVEALPQPIVAEEKREEIPQNVPASFDFGPEFQEGLPSFLLDESVETLNLTPFQMKAVTAKGLKSVRELLVDLPSMKTHADEIRQKIKELLGNDPFQKRKQLDWQALLRKLFAQVDAKERFCFLDSIGAKQLFHLKPVELHEVEKWPPEMRLKAIQKVKDALLQEKGYLQQKWSEITRSFLAPWIERRMGFGATFELEERIVAIGTTPSDAAIHALLYIGAHLNEGRSLFQQSLIELEAGIFAATEESAKNYHRLLQRARSYFYDAFSAYPLDTLISYILRDCAKEWISYSPDFIRKVLLFSPSFQLFRNEKGIIFLQKRHDYA